MTDPQTPLAMTRIDSAIARIEAAAAAHGQTADIMRKRHAALKTRMAEAVSALDDVLARGNA